MLWSGSSYSGPNGGECVEWAPGCVPSGAVPVRDSKFVDGPVLILSLEAFAGLVTFARHADLT